VCDGSPFDASALDGATDRHGKPTFPAPRAAIAAVQRRSPWKDWSFVGRGAPLIERALRIDRDAQDALNSGRTARPVANFPECTVPQVVWADRACVTEP